VGKASLVRENSEAPQLDGRPDGLVPCRRLEGLRLHERVPKGGRKVTRPERETASVEPSGLPVLDFGRMPEEHSQGCSRFSRGFGPGCSTLGSSQGGTSPEGVKASEGRPQPQVNGYTEDWWARSPAKALREWRTERDRSSESHFDEEPREGEAPAELPRGSSRGRCRATPGGANRGRPGGTGAGLLGRRPSDSRLVRPTRENGSRNARQARENSARNARQIRENGARNFLQSRENVRAIWLAGVSGPFYILPCRRRGQPNRRPGGPKGSQGPGPERVSGGSDGSLPERVAGVPKGIIRVDLRVGSGPGGLVSPRASVRDGAAGRLARDDRARKERVPRNSHPASREHPERASPLSRGFPRLGGGPQRAV
jgi:hypothetical protein